MGFWGVSVGARARQGRYRLVSQHLRVFLDDRDTNTPGWKFADWEMRGVPLRLEIGPKDIEKSSVVLARRDTRQKHSVPMDNLVEHVTTLLDEIQANLLNRARTFREERTTATADYAEFSRLMDGRPGFVVAPWCGRAVCEAGVKADTQATIRNIPFDSPVPTAPCVRCGERAVATAWFAKAY
jgi:prolyl-tRNA synthetase